MEEKRKSGWQTGVVIGLVAALLLVTGYVLSIGPAALLLDKRYLSVETVQTVYRPIMWAGKKSPSFNRAILWYIKSWTGSSLTSPCF